MIEFGTRKIRDRLGVSRQVVTAVLEATGRLDSTTTTEASKLRPFHDAIAKRVELGLSTSRILRELQTLIADTDRQIRQTFEQTFEAAARNFEELAEQLFPGGRGRLRLVTEREGPVRVLGGQNPPADADQQRPDAEFGVVADRIRFSAS